MVSEREKKLVDLAFEFAIMSARYNSDLSNDEIANWVRDNLRKLGYNVSDPIGSCWGVLCDDASD